ncbi:MAG: lysylphosphatidylglycerol synthase transmembrane domain-containing protein, partial [Candidatus Nanohaloarchaea archaeon]|nr:lysylphosphatidylglycerol synthase transmembrane domain-containing protein [Candidatus Nanohaloarchaea archaeon]
MVPDRLRSALFSKQSMFSAVLVAAAFALLFLAFDVSRALSIVAGADPGLYLLALVLFYVPFVFRGERWRLLLREAGVETPLVEATEVTFLSFFVNNVVPAQLGDLYRGHLLGRRREESRSLVTGTVFVDRVLDFAFLVVSTTLIS